VLLLFVGLPVQVSAIYMWNIISYDVLGVHYMSSSNQGSYRDNQVAGMIAGHNQRVRG
jgi:hypothetical protein